ncbi:MAG: DUF2812 domain-containing protein [Firmicutes bacterium]|nr:DUF2812 domain-containing protein [Bacillota bacterium]
MARNTVRKRVEINDIRDPYFCVWLQEMAEKGFLYKHRDLFTCVFEKASPQKRRYRVIERKWRKMSEEEKALYHDAGWAAVASYNGVTVFTTTDPDAPELFSDEDSHMRLVKRHKISSALTIVFGFLFILYWIKTNTSGIYNKEMVYEHGRLSALEYALSPQAFIVPMIIWSLIILIIWVSLVTYEFRFLKLYSGKEEFDYGIPYDDRRYIKTKNRTKRLECLVLVAILAYPLSFFLFAQTLNDGSKALAYDKNHPVLYREIDPSAWEEVVPLIESGGKQGTREVDYSAGKRRGGLVLKEISEEWLCVSERSEDKPDDFDVILDYDSEYIKVRKEDNAAEYLGERVAIHLYENVGGDDTWAKALDDVRIDCDGVDYAGYYTYKETGYPQQDGRTNQILYLRKGAALQIIR